MDPLSALSLASSVAQLIEFGSGLVAKSFRIFKSADGSLIEHVDKEVAIQHLVYLITKLQDPAASGLPDSIASQAENQALQSLCTKCRIIGEELLVCLRSGRIEGKNRKWKSFRQALRSVSTEETIVKIEMRLAALKEELDFHILVDLRKNLNSVSVQQTSQLKTLDQASQEMMQAIINNGRVFTDKLSNQIVEIAQFHRQTETSVNYGLDMLSRDILQELRGSRGMGLFQRSSGEVSISAPEKLHQQKLLRENAILHSLRFSAMGNRYTDIHEGHKNTFKWMLDGIDTEGEAQEKQPSSFVEWLKNGDGLYWINGKAGSGKSTLMRYLYNHAEARRHLRDWSGSHSLHLGGFFFWNSGASDQRSQTGLFRSLLHEILSRQREWIPDLLPDRWIALKEWAEDASNLLEAGGRPPLGPKYKWTLSRLRKVFKILVERPEASARFCLFIDGLDEYDGECGHAELVDILIDLTIFKQLKVCVSSRPWIVFEDAFRGLPGVKLESLTYGDIKQYVADILGGNPRMMKLCQAEPDEAPKLMEEIVKKAQGVFLWVELVIRSLLNGLANRDRIKDLQGRLRLLPEKLEDLYKVMLLRIDPYYRHQAAQLFRIAQAYQTQIHGAKHNLSGERSPLTVLNLAFADIEDAASMAIESPLALLTEAEIYSICEATDARLKSRCAGLLETSASKNIIHLWTSTTDYDVNSRVDYLHRTARDFLESSDTQSLLLSWSKQEEFNYSLELLAACILELKSVTLGSAAMWLSIANALAFAQDTRPQTARSQRKLLDELDSAASESWIRFRETGPRRENPDLHWSHYVPIQYDGSSSSCRDTFILYAAQHGLHDFVEHKKRQNPESFGRATVVAMARDQQLHPASCQTKETSRRTWDNPFRIERKESESMKRYQNTTLHDYRQMLVADSEDEDSDRLSAD